MYVHDADLCAFIRNRLADGSLTPPGGQPVQTERRQEERYRINQRALLHTVYPVSSKRRLVRLLDISARGLMLEAALPELIGSSVRIHTMDVFVIGEVRHCREVGERCLIGVRVDAVLYGFSSAPGNGAQEHPRVLKRAG